MDLKELARQYFRAFSAKDIDTVSSMFAEEVTLLDWGIDARGKAEVVEANTKILENVETIVVIPKNVYQDDLVVVGELDITVNGTQQIDVVDVITFNEQQQIVSVRAYKR